MLHDQAVFQPEKVHLLMSLDMEQTEKKRPYHVPVAWCKEIGDGKMLYNNMGHREDTWQNERFLESIRMAIRWIDGKEEGNAKPNPEVSAAHHAHSKKYAEQAGETQAKLDAEEKARVARAAARRAAQKAKVASAN